MDFAGFQFRSKNPHHVLVLLDAGHSGEDGAFDIDLVMVLGAGQIKDFHHRTGIAFFEAIFHLFRAHVPLLSKDDKVCKRCHPPAMGNRELSLPIQRLLRIWKLSALLLLLMTLVRIEYLIWNASQFRDQGVPHLLWAFLIGVRFDVAALAYLNAPILLLSLVPWPARWEKAWRGVFLVLGGILHLPFLLLNLGDVELVNFVGRRMTSDVLFLVGEASGKTGGIVGTYVGLVLAAVVFLLGLAWALWHCSRWTPGILWQGLSGARWKMPLLGFVSFVLFVVGARGGLQSKPLSYVNANVFAAPHLNNLSLNTSFNILRNLGQENLPRQKFFENREDMLALLNGAVTGPSLLEGRRPTRPQNVVILILESFGYEYWGAADPGNRYTPFLDSLVTKSLFFPNAMANGRRSIEGVAAVMGGIPAMMNEPFITSPFTANQFVGLGSLLGEKGYGTSFFHGGHNGTMHFDGFMRSAGVVDYFGAREYPDRRDDDGTWGIYDGPFLRWMGQLMTAMPQPFLVSFFSISSHHPYLVPAGEGDRLPEGPLPILKTVAYTDESLRRFFAAAEKEPWFKDTLFVVTGDHTAKSFLPRYDNELSRFRVPILFYHPGYEWPAGVDREQIVQQIDILPSVMDFLGLPMKGSVRLARSVFIPGERTATLHLDGRYWIADKDYFLDLPRGETPRMYAWDDAGETRPLDEPAARKDRLFERWKASVQYFSEGMWDNRLYY